MKISEQFASKYLKAADIGKRPTRYVIEAVETDEVEKGKTKMIVFFHRLDKGMVLNKTNSTTIADLYGDETDDWIDQPILLFSTKVDYQGQKVDAIRVMPPLDEEDKQAPRRDAAPRRAVEEDDERPVRRATEPTQRRASQEDEPPRRGLETRRPARDERKTVLDDLDDEIPFDSGRHV